MYYLNSNILMRKKNLFLICVCVYICVHIFQIEINVGLSFPSYRSDFHNHTKKTLLKYNFMFLLLVGFPKQKKDLWSCLAQVSALYAHTINNCSIYRLKSRDFKDTKFLKVLWKQIATRYGGLKSSMALLRKELETKF